MVRRRIIKRPYHPYEESILRTLYGSRRQMTPTKIAKAIGIHPVTAQKRMKRLMEKGMVTGNKRGKRRYYRINLKKFIK